MLRSLDLITATAPWYSQPQPKSMYENDRVVAYWDVPLFADTTHVKANRIGARIIDKERKEVKLLEMSFPWVQNGEEKPMENTRKYGPFRWELQQRHPEYKVTQHNIIIDVLGGYSQDLTKTLKQVDIDQSQRRCKNQLFQVLCTLATHLNF